MNPVGTLMREHRLIERMLAVAEREIQQARKEKSIEPLFIDTTVDFIRIYADKTHHAKEEEILFKEVALKEIAPADRALLAELLEEHDFGRRTVRELVAAKERYLAEGSDVLEGILEKLDILQIFYKEHIRKEDQIFFPAAEKYLSREEQDLMLQAFWESDRKMIHEKYRSLVEGLEGAGSL
jgi:hemerythrin-like domain-containing protein